MRIEALKAFTGPHGAFTPGDVRDVPDRVAAEWVRIGYAKPAVSKLETATLPRAEQAVSRKNR